jgi:integrase
MPRRRKLVFQRPDSPFWYCRARNERGKIVERSTKCTDEAAAIAVAKQLERESSDPVYAAANETTLHQAYGEFLAAKSHRASGTQHFYSVKEGHLARVFGEHKPLSRIDARSVDHFIATRRSEGASENTIGKELTVLRGILRLARRHGRLQRDVAEIMPVAWDSQYKPRERWLTPDELDRLVAALLVPNNADETPRGNRAAFVLFAVATGARLSEVRTARRGDVDLSAGFVRLRGTKTAAAARRVPLLPHTQALLKRALKLAFAGEALFDPWLNITRDLDVACTQAKIERVSANDLRRTFGKWLRTRGVSPDLIGEALGHVDERMAKRVYAKLTTDELGALLRSVAILGMKDQQNGRNGHQRAGAKKAKTA